MPEQSKSWFHPFDGPALAAFNGVASLVADLVRDLSPIIPQHSAPERGVVAKAWHQAAEELRKYVAKRSSPAESIPENLDSLLEEHIKAAFHERKVSPFIVLVDDGLRTASTWLPSSNTDLTALPHAYRMVVPMGSFEFPLVAPGPLYDAVHGKKYVIADRLEPEKRSSPSHDLRAGFMSLLCIPIPKLGTIAPRLDRATSLSGAIVLASTAPSFFLPEVLPTICNELYRHRVVERLSLIQTLLVATDTLTSMVRAAQAPDTKEEGAQSAGTIRDCTRPNELSRTSNIIGASTKMQEVYDQIRQVCKSQTTVLLRGESGTGKELVAELIHYNSLRTEKEFIKVNLAALSESLVESELFGHEKGAFTGALAMRQGRFELAHGGTIFLDEVGDLSPATQVKLLRVLQERNFERVGSSAVITADVRVISATNRDLEQLIQQGKFRQDLYYRLNVFTISLPALRERKTDILLLANHFATKYSRLNAKPDRRISTLAIDMLMSYHWPGNVRELENAIQRAVLVSKGDEILRDDFVPAILTSTPIASRVSGQPQTEPPLGMKPGDDSQKERILQVLTKNGGHRDRTANELGISVRRLYRYLRKWGLTSPDS